MLMPEIEASIVVEVFVTKGNSMRYRLWCLRSQKRSRNLNSFSVRFQESGTIRTQTQVLFELVAQPRCYTASQIVADHRYRGFAGGV